MTIRKVAAFVFFGMGVVMYTGSAFLGHHVVLWSLPFHLVRFAFRFPGDILAASAEAFAGRNWWPYSLAVSCTFWFFPVARIRRWFGRHDAFIAADGQRSGLTQKIAAALDALDRRRFGREKTGRWA